MSENLRGFYDSHCINYVAFLNMVRIVQGRYEQSKVRIVREPCVMAVQGHLRPLISVPVESTYGGSVYLGGVWFVCHKYLGNYG